MRIGKDFSVLLNPKPVFSDSFRVSLLSFLLISEKTLLHDAEDDSAVWNLCQILRIFLLHICNFSRFKNYQNVETGINSLFINISLEKSNSSGIYIKF